MPGIQQLSYLCENVPFISSSEHRRLSRGSAEVKLIGIARPVIAFRWGHKEYQGACTRRQVVRGFSLRHGGARTTIAALAKRNDRRQEAYGCKESKSRNQERFVTTSAGMGLQL